MFKGIDWHCGRGTKDDHFAEHGSKDRFFLLLDEVVYKTKMNLHNRATQLLLIIVRCDGIEAFIKCAHWTYAVC